MSKSRWTLFTFLMLLSLVCAVSIVRLRASDPASGSITPTSQPVTWTGTAVGGTNDGEATCVEGANCDTFTLTVTGSPADWTGKNIRITLSWVVLASDYDLYIHKGSNDGPLIASSAHGAPSTSEEASLNPSIDGTGVFTVHAVYFTTAPADQYRGVATVIKAGEPPPPPPPLSQAWNIVYHGTCCEGNLAAFGQDTYLLLPELVTGNDIVRSSDDGKTWQKKYPPVDVSDPFGIEGDLQAFGDDVIYFGTELADGVTAHSDNRGKTFTVTQFPVPFVANDQAWSYLGPFPDIAPAGQLQSEPYVLAGWYRIGSVLIFSFDGGLTFPIETPLVGNDGSGSVHVVCRNNSHAPNNAPDSRVPDENFAMKKAGHYGSWGTDRQFYWTEPAGGDLYVCHTDDFGANWIGIKHPIPPGPGQGFVVSNSAFDEKGTLYVTHGDRLFVSFNQGESWAFVHKLPRFGNSGRTDPGADEFFVVDNGTIHIALLENAGEGRGRVYYLRGIGVDTAEPIWDEELVDEVGDVRLDFIQIVLNGNGIPTISYTTPEKKKEREVTTASRKAPLPASAPRLLNISTRARVKTGDNVLIGGFIITGTLPRPVIVRALGPSLKINRAPVPGRLSDPTLELYEAGNATPIATNDNWKAQRAAVKASGLPPPNDAESAIVRTLAPGAYTAVVRGKGGDTGIALAEVYDLGAGSDSQLANLSTRGFVELSDNAMIGGFIIGPKTAGPTNVVVRGIGPSLMPGIPGALDDPTLQLFDSNGTSLELNDNWQQSPGASKVQNVKLAPTKTAEAAIFAANLAPGGYTAVLRGKGQTTGVGLVEVYDVP